jgi:transcriptional regulator with XRE-family HTH domain
MKTKLHTALRQLRTLTGQTQAEFAEMIGASKDTVVSWDVGRNKLSRAFARRIAIATGVDEESLLRGGPLMASGHPAESAPFTAETFARHRSTTWGRSDEAAARHHLAHCADALGLLFRAAARPAEGRDRKQLPALLAAFQQWCEEAATDFGLREGIEAQLMERTFKIGREDTYGSLRRLAKEAPAQAEALGFQDDPSKPDDEKIFIGAEARPDWTPGACMKGEIPGRTVIVRWLGRRPGYGKARKEA